MDTSYDMQIRSGDRVGAFETDQTLITWPAGQFHSSIRGTEACQAPR